MKIALSKQKHKAIFGNLFKVINRSTVLASIEKCLVEIGDGIITYTVTDLETTLIYKEETDDKSTLSFCIDASDFLFFLQNAIDDSVIMEIHKDVIKLSSGGFTVKLPKESTDNYPVISKENTGISVRLGYKVLSEKISKALICVSNDDLRPALTGVLVHGDSDKISIACTDAHSLFFDDIVSVENDLTKYILPSKSCKMYIYNFKGKDCEVIFSDNTTVFISDNIIMRCRNIDCRYPDYKAVVQVYDFIFYMKRKQFVSFLKIAIRYVSRSSLQLIMQVSNESISFTGGDNDFGLGIEYNVPIYNKSSNTDPFIFAANLRFIKNIASASNDEYIKITHSKNSQKSFIIDNNYLLMPLLIN